ncbi:MAG: hypothetical protein Q7T56_05270 [Nocardioidaceae bacterium]|nr:hypothetical protein [Nocardioidaceae bacterium]
MTTTTTAGAAQALSTTNRIGLGIFGLLGLLDAVSLLTGPDTEVPGETGPPMGILVLDTVLGVLTVVTVVWAWRTANRSAIRLTAGARILSVVTALPAFFVDVPAGVKVLVAAFVVVTAVALVMMLTPARRASRVTD